MKRINYLQFKHMLFVILISFIVTCCKDDSSEIKVELAAVKTIEVRDVMYNQVTVASSIISNGGDSITERGICWSKQPNPTISDFLQLNSENDDNDFFVELKNLESNIQYYVRSYAVNSKGIAYGEELTFTLWLNKPEESISDIDNNSYSTIRIGNQVWMKENLRVTHYRNGDPIKYLPLENDFEWINTNSGAYCAYEDTHTNAEKYGYLYNGFAVADERNVCPEGWHVPTIEEWTVLFNYLGGCNTELSASLLRHDQEWRKYLPNNNTNLSGFSALPGGVRIHYNNNEANTHYFHISEQAYFATPDVHHNSIGDYDQVWFATIFQGTGVYPKITPISGLSIRCIKD